MPEKRNRENLTALFLKQSLLDCQDDFSSALTKRNHPRFKVIALTASNEHQADAYRRQLAIRKLPSDTEFVVIPDRNGERVGSGGATLSVIKYVTEKYGSFSGISVACIHSGGDSKRTPNYSALGKLFSPVPRLLPDGRPSTLFDEFMISIASVPGRMREGMLLLSGDVLLLFNPLQIDYSGRDAAAISFKEDVETGKEHGVYLKGDNGKVKAFLHKQSEETLREIGAVDQRGNIDIDTGAVIFSPEICQSLYGLIDTPEKEDAMINPRTRLSLYGDFLYPLAEDSTLEGFYLEKPEGEYCDELKTARKQVWDALHGFNMKLMNLSPAKFIHFGTVGEIMKLMRSGVNDYGELGWKREIHSSCHECSPTRPALYNSIVEEGASVGDYCYFENSYIHSGVTIGNNVLVSGVELSSGTVPDGVAVHGLKQSNGKYICRIWNISDNPKEFWNEARFPECGTMQDAFEASMECYCGCCKDENGYLLKSLSDGFNDADSQAIIDWAERMKDCVLMEKLAEKIRMKYPASEISATGPLSKVQTEWMERTVHGLDISCPEDFSFLIRLYYYIGKMTGEEKYTSLCFDTIAKAVLNSSLENLKFNKELKIRLDDVTVNLPLRVNWGGGWSDTCPHCLEHGGTVLNAAVSLEGALPVEVRLIKIPEHKVVFDSRDMDVHGEFCSLEPLQSTGDPYDPFALQKACLIACGVIPDASSGEPGSFDDIIQRLGGGFEMHSEVTNVPKGSGLGTSSILAAACVEAVSEFFGLDLDEDGIFSHVLAMEQIMSTGGGWQDQVGGAIPGIKLVTSNPGLKQEIRAEKVVLKDEVLKELNDRFCLIYTGQRRLARNLLRDVVGRYVGNERDSLYAHEEIQKTAILMRTALEDGDVDEFARLLDEHWTLSKKIDEGSTNTLIDQIFLSIEDLIDARMVCGAGGGGFLQVILKKGVKKSDIHARLKDVFQDFAVDVWESSIIMQ